MDPNPEEARRFTWGGKGQGVDGTGQEGRTGAETGVGKTHAEVGKEQYGGKSSGVCWGAAAMAALEPSEGSTCSMQSMHRIPCVRAYVGIMLNGMLASL